MGAIERIRAAAETRFGVGPEHARSLHGGSLSEVLLLEWSDGRQAVAKAGPLVPREGRMLRAIRASGAVAPDVLGTEGDVLFLEALNEAPSTPQSWRALGQTLRRLHGTRGQDFGWREDYAFGSVQIPNSPASDWPAFWAEQRLRPTAQGGPADICRRVDQLVRRLPELLPDAPPAALLHGDLWSGNVVSGPDGSAHLIDPACYYGHAEVDLAMVHLFGKPDPAFAEGYGPLDPGVEDRRPIYQLWPALVHLRLFGNGYRGLVERCLTSVGA